MWGLVPLCGRSQFGTIGRDDAEGESNAESVADTTDPTESTEFTDGVDVSGLASLIRQHWHPNRPHRALDDLACTSLLNNREVRFIRVSIFYTTHHHQH